MQTTVTICGEALTNCARQFAPVYTSPPCRLLGVAVALWLLLPRLLLAQSGPALLGDLDADGRIGVLDLTRLQMHLSGASLLLPGAQLSADLDQDGLVTEIDVEAIADTIMGLRPIQELPPARILSTSPALGEGNVSLTRETIIRFTQPLAATNVITTNKIYAVFGGRRILSRVELANDRRALTLFYLEPLPASARVRVTIDGNGLASLLGVPVDADGNGSAGGMGVIDFDTASITPLPGTAVIGTVYASELAPGTNGLTNSINVPLAGVTITVDGAEQTLRTVTDSNGFFRLTPCPAGRFFVHVDGRTVTNLATGIRYPDLAYYPFVGKAWEAFAGVMTNLAGGSGLIYLPLIQQGTLRNVSSISNTIVTFPPGVIASNPALAGVSLTVPPDALYNDSGTRGGQVGISPVAPNRLPEPLPPGLNFPLVITVQTDGPSNFREPVPICFPNLPDPETGRLLPPGAKSALWSFNHDTGRWELQGPMTVSEDGRFACTDPGVGISQPGWHGSFPGSGGGGGDGGAGGDGCGPCCDDCCEGSGDGEDGANAATDDCCRGGDGPTNPIRLFSGEKHEKAVDLRIKGVGLDFVWQRTYRSKQGVNTAQGNGWDFSYNMSAAVDGRGIRVSNGAARADLYHPQSDGTWSRKGYARQLSVAADGSGSSQHSTGTQLAYHPLRGAPNAGRIRALSDRNGNTLKFDYDNQGRLSKVTDTLNREILVAYNADGFIDSITDFAGRSVRYTYYAQGEPGGSFGDLKSVTTPAIIGTPNGNDFPSGKTTTYTYTSGYADDRLNHNLLTITDGRRNDPNDPTFGSGPYLQNVYSTTTDPFDPDFDHVIRQIRGGSIIDLTYVPQRASPSNDWVYMKTILRDGVGNVSERFFKANNLLVKERRYTGRAQTNQPTTETLNRPTGKLRSEDPPYFETRYEYNGDFALIRTIYPNGNLTEKIYEADLNPSASPRTRRNLRMIRHLPGTHLPAGDQSVIEEQFEYDTRFGCPSCGFNFVTKHTDGRDNSLLNQYDDRGNLLARTNRIASVVERFAYNERGQMTNHVHPDNGSGHRRVDVMTYYDSGPMKGYLKEEIVDSGGFNLTTRYEYDLVGNVVRRVDPRGHDTLYSVNALDQVLRETSAEIVDGSDVRYLKDYFYDANNNLARLEIENRNALEDGGGIVATNPTWTTTYEYEILNRLVRTRQEVEPGRFVAKDYAYDANRNRVLTRFGEATAGRQPNNVLRLIFDERDLVFREVRAPGSPDQATTQYDYDPNRNLVRTLAGIESGSHITINTYDGYNRLVGVTDAMGNVTSRQYDANGNTIRTIVFGELVDQPGSQNNVRLREVATVYDGMNRRVRTEVEFFDAATQTPIGDGKVVTSIAYSDTSQVISQTNDNNHTSQIIYDTVNRRRTLTDAKGNTVTYVFDANSNVTELRSVEKNDLGGPDELFTTRKAFDNLDRLIAGIDNIGNTTRLGYDSRGNRVRVTDARGNVTRSIFDGLSRLVETAREMSSTGTTNGTIVGTIRTRQAWDDSSRVSARSDDNGNTTRYVYDGLSRMVEERFADSTTVTAAYDAHHRPIRLADANGSIQTLVYDAAERLMQKEIVPGPGVSSDTTFERFQYDGLSRLVSGQDNDSLVTMDYDSRSRRTRETLNGKSTLCTNDGLGNVLSCRYPGGRLVTCSYDELERKQSISDQQGPIAVYGYVGVGRVARRDYGNGTRLLLEYDGISGVPNQPGDLGVKQVTRTKHLRISDGATLADHSYTFDSAYNKTLWRDLSPSGETDAYAYDSVNRLVRSERTPANGGPQLIDYSLDGVGNRISVAGGDDAGAYSMSNAEPGPADQQVNQYTSTPFDAREYDKKGNLGFTDHTRPTQRSYVYDYRNRLVSFTDPAGLQTTYRYDALGRRIEKITHVTPARITRFFLQGHREIEEQDGTGNTEATYVYGNYIDEVLTMHRGGANHYYHSDNLFNIVAVSDASGAVVERYNYQDYGTLTITDLSGTVRIASAIGNPFLFTGRRFDTESGHYFYRSRYLDARSGRFIARDELGIWADALNMGNAYAYVGNNPTKYLDPFGHFAPSPAALVFEEKAIELGMVAGSPAGPVGVVIGGVIGGVVGAAIIVGGAIIVDDFLDSSTEDAGESKEEDDRQLELPFPPQPPPNPPPGPTIDQQQRADRHAYHERCDETPPPGLTGCDLLRWKLQRALVCIKMRQDYIDKWNDTYPGHPAQIEQVKNSVRNLEEAIKRRCQPCPSK